MKKLIIALTILIANQAFAEYTYKRNQYTKQLDMVGGEQTQAEILNKLATSTDGAILILTQGPTEADDSPRIQIKHRDGTVNVQINTDGTFQFNQGMFSYAP